MKREIKYDSQANSAQSFGALMGDIKGIAEESERTVASVIDDLITDLQNYDNEDYEKKIPEIDVFGDISTNLITKLIAYLNKMKKTYIQAEKREAKKKKRESKNAELEITLQGVEERINSLISGENGMTQIDAIESIILELKEGQSDLNLSDKQTKEIIKVLQTRLKEAKEENQRVKIIEEKLQEIEAIVEREYKAGNGTRPQIWTSIRSMLTGQEDDNKDTISIMKIGSSCMDEILQRVDQRINEEKDLLYYDQVKDFTRNFRFLAQSSEVIKATMGVSQRKFTDQESYMRFCELRSLLQNGYNDEYKQIGILLSGGSNLGDMDKRILSERKATIQREREKQTTEGR